jgi:hypothetical protein
MIEKVRLSEKFAQFHDTWSPKIVGELQYSTAFRVYANVRKVSAMPRCKGA